jgi:hypothetical protein
MAHATKKGHGPTWRHKEEDEKFDNFKTKDGTEYTLHVPNFNQPAENRKSSERYKDVFDKIKTKVKNDPAIEKNEDGLPILHHVAWAELLSSTLKELNKPWKVKEKIWVYNIIHDPKKKIAMYVAITPNIKQNTDKIKARKVSARKVSTRKVSPMPPAPPSLDSDNAVLHDGYISDKDIVFGTEPLGTITQEFHVRTQFNGNKYYYLNKKDADEGNSNYDHVEEYVSEDEKSIASADEDEGEKASKGGKSTRKHIRRKSTSKRTTTRRK